VYRWHSVVEAPLGPTVQEAVVISEDPWNQWARSPIIVPLLSGVRANALRPTIGQSTIADCTRPLTVTASRLGAVLGSLSTEESAAVRSALASMLNVDHLLQGTTPPQPAAPPSVWYPHFAHIYFDTLEIDGEQKMFAILSDDLWNVTERFVIGLRLTSRSKPARARWEVPLSGGPIIIGDLHLIPTSRLNQTPPRPPHPVRCTVPQGAAIGRGLQQVLKL
jgi:mRNA-degrading endonuclease toxin of MazEF toxin-antitoxin module